MNQESGSGHTIDDSEILWREAHCFAEICQLAARHIEGELPSPSGEKLDSESTPLLQYLAAYNRKGYWTDCSQPRDLGTDYRQRAFVTGLAKEELSIRIAKLTLYSDLIVLAFPPKGGSGCHIPVTVSEFQPFTWAGMNGDEMIEFYRDICSVSAMSELEDLWSVTVIDPVWGRNDCLWQRVAEELCYDAAPHPQLADGRSFLY